VELPLGRVVVQRELQPRRAGAGAGAGAGRAAGPGRAPAVAARAAAEVPHGAAERVERRHGPPRPRQRRPQAARVGGEPAASKSDALRSAAASGGTNTCRWSTVPAGAPGTAPRRHTSRPRSACVEEHRAIETVATRHVAGGLHALTGAAHGCAHHAGVALGQARRGALGGGLHGASGPVARDVAAPRVDADLSDTFANATVNQIVALTGLGNVQSTTAMFYGATFNSPVSLEGLGSTGKWTDAG